MLKRIIFHVGQAKAASTAFQNLAEAHHEALLGRGILFPLSVLARKNRRDATRTPGHLDLLSLRTRADARQDLLHEYATHVGHIDTLVLSAEDIFDIYQQPKIHDFAAFLASAFPGAETEILAVLRHPLGWLRSLYYERVMGVSCEQRNIADFLAHYEAEGVLDYAGVLRSLATTFHAKKVKALDFLAPDTPVVPAMFAQIDPGLDLTRMADSPVNVSVAVPELVAAKRHLNLFLKEAPDDLRRALAERLKCFAQAQIAAGRARKAPEHLTAGLEPRILADFEPRHRRLSEMYLDGRKLVAPGKTPLLPALDKILIEELTNYGLNQLVPCLAEHEASGADGRLMDVTSSELDHLMQMLSDHPVSLHLGWPETALLAGCWPGRLVTVAETRSLATLRLGIRLDQAELPSEIIVVPLATPDNSTAPVAEDILALWKEPFFRPPGLVIIGRGMPVGRILQHLAAQGGQTVVIMQDSTELLDLSLADFNVENYRLHGTLASFHLHAPLQDPRTEPTSLAPKDQRT